MINNKLLDMNYIKTETNQVINEQSSSINDAYSCNYVNDCNTYSTSETNTGKKWIDGKDIYRKCFSFTNTTTSNETIGTITNLDRIVDIYGSAINNGNIKVHIPISSGEVFTFWIDGNNLIKQCTNWYVNNNTQIVVLEYTKTTN